MQQCVRNRQETVNKWMKDWGILKQVYCHKFKNHGEIFCAIIIVTQPLFSCGYRDLPYNLNLE